MIVPPPVVWAQFAPTVLPLPSPGVMVPVSPVFTPTLIKGIKIFPDNPLRFDFVIDGGDADFKGDDFKAESTKLIKYFLASLTVPEEDLWVNLSPHEQDRIIPEQFGVTEMGRDLLAQDYLLKQLTASLMYPEEELGKKFWDKIYQTAYERYGTTEIPVNTFNKVWIVPEKAVVYENGDTAYVVESRLKVMLDSDYKSMEYQKKERSEKLEEGSIDSELQSSIIREIILPEIEREVNEGENFAPLRQIYHSLILASWFKRNLKSSILNQVYVGQNKITGVDIEDKQVKDKIYQQYLKAFKKGVYNYIKEDYDPATRETIPRKYFSGGMELGFTSLDLTAQSSPVLDVVQKVNFTQYGQIYTTNGQTIMGVLLNPEVDGEKGQGVREQIQQLAQTIQNQPAANEEKHAIASSPVAVTGYSDVSVDNMVLRVHGALPQEYIGFIAEAVSETHEEIPNISTNCLQCREVFVDYVAEKFEEEQVGIMGANDLEEGRNHHWIPYVVKDGKYITVDITSSRYLEGDNIAAEIMVAESRNHLLDMLRGHYGGRKWQTLDEMLPVPESEEENIIEINGTEIDLRSLNHKRVEVSFRRPGDKIQRRIEGLLTFYMVFPEDGEVELLLNVGRGQARRMTLKTRSLTFQEFRDIDRASIPVKIAEGIRLADSSDSQNEALSVPVFASSPVLSAQDFSRLLMDLDRFYIQAGSVSVKEEVSYGAFNPSDIGDVAYWLKEVGFQPGQKFIDLGAGDGRVTTAVALLFGAQAYGYEHNPSLFDEMIQRAKNLFSEWKLLSDETEGLWRQKVFRKNFNRWEQIGEKSSVNLMWGDYLDASFEDVDVAYLWNGEPVSDQLKTKLSTLKPGAYFIHSGPSKAVEASTLSSKMYTVVKGAQSYRIYQRTSSSPVSENKAFIHFKKEFGDEVFEVIEFLGIENADQIKQFNRKEIKWSVYEYSLQLNDDRQVQFFTKFSYSGIENKIAVLAGQNDVGPKAKRLRDGNSFIMSPAEGIPFKDFDINDDDLIVDFAGAFGYVLGKFHKMGYVHRDIKFYAELAGQKNNFFIEMKPSGQMVVRLIDFGSSREISSSKKEFQYERTDLLRNYLRILHEKRGRSLNDKQSQDIETAFVQGYEQGQKEKIIHRQEAEDDLDGGTSSPVALPAVLNLGAHLTKVAMNDRGNVFIHSTLPEADLQESYHQIIRNESNGTLSLVWWEDYGTNADLNEMDRRLGIKQAVLSLNQNRQDETEPLVLLEWGIGRGKAFFELAQWIEERGIQNVILIGFDDTKPGDWHQYAQQLEVFKNVEVHFVYDIDENLIHHFEGTDSLPAPKLIYGLDSIKDLERKSIINKTTQLKDHLIDLSGILAKNGEMRFYPSNMSSESATSAGLNVRRISRPKDTLSYIRLTVNMEKREQTDRAVAFESRQSSPVSATATALEEAVTSYKQATDKVLRAHPDASQVQQGQLGYQYYQLMGNLVSAIEQIAGEPITFVYPLSGPDRIPALHRKTVNINHDPNDAGIGVTILGYIERNVSGFEFDFDLNAENMIYSKKDNAMDPESYAALDDFDGPRVFILKGFDRYYKHDPFFWELDKTGNSKEYSEEEAEKILRHALDEKLREGDFLLILDKNDMPYQILAEEYGFEVIGQTYDEELKSLPSLSNLHGNVRFLLMPDALALMRKGRRVVSSPVRGDVQGEELVIHDLIGARKDLPAVYNFPSGAESVQEFDWNAMGDKIRLETKQPKVLILGASVKEVRLLAKLYPRGEIYVATIAEGELKNMKKEFAKEEDIAGRLELFYADASQLDVQYFPDQSFDLIFAQKLDESVFRDEQEGQRILAKINREEERLIRPGGIIFHQNNNRDEGYDATVFFKDAVARGELIPIKKSPDSTMIEFFRRSAKKNNMYQILRENVLKQTQAIANQYNMDVSFLKEDRERLDINEVKTLIDLFLRKEGIGSHLEGAFVNPRTIEQRYRLLAELEGEDKGFNGNSSLHLANGFSRVFLVDLLMGMDVTVSDFNKERISSLDEVVRERGQWLLDIARLYGGSLNMKAVDAFQLSEIYTDDSIDHITMINFYPDGNVPFDEYTSMWQQLMRTARKTLFLSFAGNWEMDNFKPLAAEHNFRVIADHLTAGYHPSNKSFLLAKVGAFSSPVGGVDLNPAGLDIETTGEGMVDFDLPFDVHVLETLPITGFTPVIINITPMMNLPLYLGLRNPEEENPRPLASAEGKPLAMAVTNCVSKFHESNKFSKNKLRN